MRVAAALLAVVALLLIVATGGPGAAAPDDPVSAAAEPIDSVPPGMVAFFDGDACPAGWEPAVLAAGRMLIATDVPLAIGRTVGAALGPAEDRTHTHGVTGATIALPARSISAANGPNQSGAAAGGQPLSGGAGAATSGLPFAQLTACVRP